MSSSKPANDARTQQSALRYLRTGTRSAAELQRFLQSRGIAPTRIRTLLTEGRRRGWLDDAACAALVATSLSDRGYAARLIAQRLAAKGLGDSLIARTLARLNADVDDASRALAFVRARAGGRRTDDRLRARLGRALAARGFDADLISQVLVEALGPVDPP